MRQSIRGCGVCGEAMRGTEENGVWLADEPIAEVYDPDDPDEDSVTCHESCIPRGWETA